MDVLKTIDKRKHWWKIFVLILTVSIAVVGYIGHKSYTGAPPLAEFKTESGETLFRGESIIDGQQVFLRRGLMEYGSFLGDGGMRGPDYTGQALNLTARWMNDYYLAEEAGAASLLTSGAGARCTCGLRLSSSCLPRLSSPTSST